MEKLKAALALAKRRRSLQDLADLIAACDEYLAGDEASACDACPADRLAESLDEANDCISRLSDEREELRLRVQTLELQLEANTLEAEVDANPEA